MTDPNVFLLEAKSPAGESIPWSDLVVAVWRGEGEPDEWIVQLRKHPTATTRSQHGSATALSIGMSDPSANLQDAEVRDAS